jgi:hypothetical protein
MAVWATWELEIIKKAMEFERVNKELIEIECRLLKSGSFDDSQEMGYKEEELEKIVENVGVKAALKVIYSLLVARNILLGEKDRLIKTIEELRTSSKE